MTDATAAEARNAEQVWQGEDALRPMLVPIAEVHPHPRNPRQGDVGAMSLSLERFGQYRPAVVQADTGHIVAGSHMWKAAAALGWTHLAVIVRAMDDAEAAQLMLADNRVADRGGYDQDALAAVMRDLAEQDALHPATGYDLDDLDDLLADLERVPAPLPATPADGSPAPAPGVTPAPSTPGHRELRLLIPEDEWPPFAEALERVREAAGVDTAPEAVVFAVRACADELT
jgi:ParB-like chromosome segregation protein Spo0J